MTFRVRCLAVGLVSVAAVSPLGVAGAATSSVSIVSYMFTPASLTIHVGDTVVWKNNDPPTTLYDHTASSDDSHTFDSGMLAPGHTYSFTFTKAGTFSYHCNVHAYMTASITVTSTSPTHTPTPTPTHSRTQPPRATATAKPTVPASPTPARSVKPSPHASHTTPASTSATPTPTNSRIVATGATSSISWGLVTGIVAVAIALVGIAGFAVRRRRTVR